jgi:hypothetical protein
VRPRAKDISRRNSEEFRRVSEEELHRAALELRLLIETVNTPIVGRVSHQGLTLVHFSAYREQFCGMRWVVSGVLLTKVADVEPRSGGV